PAPAPAVLAAAPADEAGEPQGPEGATETEAGGLRRLPTRQVALEASGGTSTESDRHPAPLVMAGALLVALVAWVGRRLRVAA
ncbi:MAG: hypothetical protein KY439_11070, partial [Actinobacteria bacterium]|nr:hypothetical protein [Actinomycetota bacterium]